MLLDDENDEKKLVRYALLIAIAKDEADYAAADYDYDKERMSAIDRRLTELKKLLEDTFY